jgi:hypothetical protein
MVNRRIFVIMLAVAAIATASASAQSKDASATLGSVHLSRAVEANGQSLAADTYQIRLANDPVTPVVGQSPEGERWVEFVKGGTVAGKEVASVISAADIKSVAKGPVPPAGAPRIEMLQGGEYLRIWIVKSGTTYLVHLRTAAK